MVRADFTLRVFPSTGAVKDATGLPFSCVLQPFAKLPSAAARGAAAGEAPGAQMPAFLEVLRCSKCFGYINCHCSFQPPTWQCSLCNHVNDIKHLWANRYNQGLEALPELRSDAYEMLMDEAGPFAADPLTGDMTGPAPVLLALVDATGGEEWMELVRSALLAALEAVPPYTLFGLCTFSNKLGLHDLRGSVPSVRYVELREGTTQPVAIPCSQVMPLRALLAPVGLFKERIAEALEALASEGGTSLVMQAPPATTTTQNGGAAGPGQGLQEPAMQRLPQPPGRGLGPALLGMLEFLQGVSRAPFRPSADQVRSSATTAMQQSDALPPSQSPVRLMTFLAGPPDWGTGRLLNPKKFPGAAPRAVPSQQQQPQSAGGASAASTVGVLPDDTWLQDVSPSSTHFYEQAAVAAAAIGCCCDVYSISEGAVGLEYLDPLANATGGATYMYPSVEDSALPQDVYRRLQGAHAAAGVLRLRCSPAFKAARHYGRLYPDQQVENLHHVVSCCDADTFAVDFELSNPAAGFTAPGQGTPVLQVAFQYTTVVPAPAADKSAAQPPQGQQGQPGHLKQQEALQQQQSGARQDGGAKAPAAARCMLQRRLRVATFKLPVSGNPLEVMRSCSSEALLVVLLHKISKVAAAQGNPRARLVLRDWLANLATNYHHLLHAALAAKGQAELLNVPVDVSFAQAEALQPVPRLVYALLRSPLLAPPIEAQHPDLVPFMASLWSSLPPPELQRAVYPMLSSYADPDTLVLLRHSLSRGALLADGAPPIFLLDAYVLLVVLYTLRAPPSLPFPPSQTSALRRVLATVRQERRITPQVRFVREGTDEAALFFHLLLDEPDQQEPTVVAAAAAGAAGAPGLGGGASAPGTPAVSGGGAASTASFGLVQFLEHIRLEVLAALKAEAQAAAAAGGGGSGAGR